MIKQYTDEKNALIIIALLKQHGIKRVIISPGATNITFVASIQSDSFFELYSCVDERSAAYMACGLAAETGESVVLSCTSATASRNYLPGLTEAFYRKLPVLAITSTPDVSRVGHHNPQVIDRSAIQNDVVRYSVCVPIIKDDNDFWDCEIKVNKAILELTRHGGGPVHINLPTLFSKNFKIQELPKVRVIKRVNAGDSLPIISKGRIGIFIGSHKKMSADETLAIDSFCSTHNAVVFCDHTSNYYGKYRILFSLVAAQQMFNNSKYQPDLLIHIGEITGDYYTLRLAGSQVWRINPDGELRDTFKKLAYVFEMSEITFFNLYSNTKSLDNSYYSECFKQLHLTQQKVSSLPFSNIWIASQIAHKIPTNSVIHFGILNSLRSWNFFELPVSVQSSSNVGGFGIDGGMSSLVGASFANKEKLYFLIIGDLAFFYDMNVLGNRHISNNIRILLVNNGKGTEFRQFNHPGAAFEEDSDKFIAAAGHFGNKSKSLVKHYSEDLGFDYFCANDKNEFNLLKDIFVSPIFSDKPILIEIFTDNESESNALEQIMNLEANFSGAAKKIAKKVLSDKMIGIVKNFIHE